MSANLSREITLHDSNHSRTKLKVVTEDCTAILTLEQFSLSLDSSGARDLVTSVRFPLDKEELLAFGSQLVAIAVRMTSEDDEEDQTSCNHTKCGEGS